MKPKWIFRIMAVLMILSMFFISQGAERFYYGSWFGTEHAYMLKDSLKFNIIEGQINSSNIDSLADGGLRAIVHAIGDNNPTWWSWVSHYTLWEAEGLEGSYYGLSYNGGTLVDDDSASGGKAMRLSGPGTPDTIQWGPGYYQERGPEEEPIKYTAEFRLKYHYNLYTPPGPSAPVCSLRVVDTVTHSVLKDTVLYKSDFPGSGIGGYKTFELKDYTVPGWNQIDFQIYWCAPPEAVNFYIDYVKVYDENGWRLIDEPTHYVANGIKAYVSQPWVDTTRLETGETVVYRWYMRDQPPSIDYFAPYVYVDSLLREVSTERVGMQAYCRYIEDTLTHEYFLRENPQEYHVDPFPTKIYEFGSNFSGSAYQQGMDTYVSWLKRVKEDALAHQKDLWVTCQAFAEGWSDTSGCPDSVVYYQNDSLQHSDWYCFRDWRREPTPNEVRLQSFLALCYGAQSLMYFRYSYINYYDASQGKWFFGTGLYDQYADSLTGKWRELKNFTGPRIEKLGPISKELTWQGAGFCENVDTITGSFIDSLKPAPGETLLTTYVQVGFFKDDADTDYFMLVNRRCLENEDQNVTVYIDSASFIDNKKMWYVIDQYSQDTTFTGAINGAIPFTTHLAPGEGKLFKLISFADSAFHGTTHPLTWQGGIMVDGDVTVDSVESHASSGSSRCATIKSFDQSSL